MPYSRLSTKVSGYLVEELNYPEEKRDIISYSLDTLFLLVAGYITIFLIGWLIGIPGAVLCTLLSGDILRKFSGGFHLSTPFRCLALTAFMYIAVSWLSVHIYAVWGAEPVYGYILVLICFACLIIVRKYAPVDNPAKPIVSVIFRKKLRMSSILIVIILSVLVIVFNDRYIASAITGGLTVQTFTLLPFLNK